MTCYRLQIESEKLFVDVIEVLAAAMHWEKRATCILAQEADLSEFEDVIRFVVLSLLFMRRVFYFICWLQYTEICTYIYLFIFVPMLVSYLI